MACFVGLVQYLMEVLVNNFYLQYEKMMIGNHTWDNH